MLQCLRPKPMVMSMDIQKDKYDLDDLKALMKRLRNPDNGCPWDIEQTFETIKPHTVEEAYEVADAIERGNMDDMKDELGDLLFQVIFHAQMGDEANLFSFDDIIDHVTKKMIFRHPHVFGTDTAKTADDVKDTIWEAQKEKEKPQSDSALDGLTMNLPSLLLTSKIQKKAIKTGFTYPSIDDVFAKINEERQELKDAIATGDQNEIDEEFGDVLFATALLAKHCGVNNPEEALRAANIKFVQRFQAMEDRVKAEGKGLKDMSVDQMIEHWNAIKTLDRQKP